MSHQLKRSAVFFFFIIGASVVSGAGEHDDFHRLKGEAERLDAALAEAPEDHGLLLQAGTVRSELAAFFDPSSADEAVVRLEAAYRHDRDPMTKALLGRAYALAARNAGDYLKRFSFAQRAMRCADEAAAEKPDDPLVRLLRAENFCFLPDGYERRMTVMEDFEYLFTRYKKDPQCFAGLFDPARVFFFRALFFIKDRQMEQAYRYALTGEKIAFDGFLLRRLGELLTRFEE